MLDATANHFGAQSYYVFNREHHDYNIRSKDKVRKAFNWNNLDRS